MPAPTNASNQGFGQPGPALTFIDLFCGCGGFTLGMQRAGFRCLAAVDFSADAVGTLRTNLAEVQHTLNRDLTKFPPEDLARLIGMDRVDVVVGGPPCQGFSTARQVDGANHGARLKTDPRRLLYQEFLKYVKFFRPRIFVMENVLGLRNAAGGEFFTRVQKEARELGRAAGGPGYRVHGQVEDAWELGVPQKRRRQFIIGVRNDLPGYFPPEIKPAPRAAPRTCLGAAIGDLPILRAGGGNDERKYDYARRAMHLRNVGEAASMYLFNVLEVERATTLTNHIARPHSDRDLRDFARLREGESSAVAMRCRGIGFEYPYDKASFKDRYTRQSRRKPCSTIVAHLSKDGLMFIHPTQNRSLTPREAARVQSFPDWFRFPSSRTCAFRLVGNAIPPLISEAIGLAAKDFLRTAQVLGTSIGVVPREHEQASAAAQGDTVRRSGDSRAFISRAAAASALECVARLDRRALRAMFPEDFLRGWHALLFLFPGLHPDNALDHGCDIEIAPANQLALPGFDEVLSRRYARSGWPVALELIGREGWRRYVADEISKEEFYCIEAQRAGLTTDWQPECRHRPSYASYTKEN